MAMPMRCMRRRLYLVAILFALAAPAHGQAPASSGAAPAPKPPEATPAPAAPQPSEAAPKPPETPPQQTAKPVTPKNLELIPPDEAAGILGKKVVGPKGDNMGLVVDVLVDSDGRPRAAVIDFGGFLGVGTRKIAVDWQLLEFRPGDAAAPVVLDLSREELQGAPEYKASPQEAQIVGPPGAEGSPLQYEGK